MTDEAVAAWRAVLIGRAAAAYGYAAAGPLLAENGAAAGRYDEHLRHRDEALLVLAGAGAQDLAVPTVFTVPALPGASAARAFLAGVEARLVGVLADLVPRTDGRARIEVLDEIAAATTWAMRWGAGTGAWGPAAAD